MARPALREPLTVAVLDPAHLESLWLTPPPPAATSDPHTSILAGALAAPTPYLSALALPVPGVALVRREPGASV